MTHDPLVSVVIPTFNRAGIICRTIDNVFEQTYKNFEVIIVDDGSTDDTLSILRERYGDRIRLFAQKNAGPAVARNHGVKVSKGEIITFQDSDDLWHASKLERQVALMMSNTSIPCCLCNVRMGFVKGKPFTSFDHSLIELRHEEGIWTNVLDVLATRFILFNQASAIRREVFEKIGGFREDLKYLEDYDLPLRLALEGPWAVIREPLVFYGEDSPVSFSEQARRNPILLNECELRVYDWMLDEKNTGGVHASARGRLKRRQAMARRQLTGAKLRNNGSAVAGAINSLLLRFDHYRLAAYRRSPWFPQPETAPVGSLS